MKSTEQVAKARLAPEPSDLARLVAGEHHNPHGILGAHTAKDTPSTTPSAVVNDRGCAPRTSHSRSWRPSLNKCRSTSPKVGKKR